MLFEGTGTRAREGGDDEVFFFVGVDGAEGFEVVGEGGVGVYGCFCGEEGGRLVDEGEGVVGFNVWDGCWGWG